MLNITAGLKDLFFDSGIDSLPSRVRDAIRAQQDRSERLIGWVQLIVVLTFAGLYLVSPKPEVMFDLTPWALITYLGLTVIRLIWARRERLPAWSLAVSVVFDMTLLMVLIWSFHIKYDQPASFYLKAPTLLYVFIFIALRALRFDARFVLLAGLVASIGWGILIVYVVTVSPENPMITRDYIDYLTSNSILLGAEFDKIISILVVTIIIAAALQRARGLLIRAVTEQAAAQELSRFFAPEIASKIKQSDQQILAGTGEAREAAILNVDMRGFTKLAEVEEPDRVMSLLAEYQSLMVPAIQKHGGSIDKFMGDGILATFGAAQPSETYAADALRAVDEIIRVSEDWRERDRNDDLAVPAVNASVATGRILFGAVGDETRLEYTVIGDAVNLSAKLEKENKTQKVRAICDAETFEQARVQGYESAEEKERRIGCEVGGVAHPVDLVVLAA